MKKLLFILLILVSSNLFAQFSKEEQRQIDSLRIVINNHSMSDSSRVKSIIELGELFYYFSPDSSLKYVRRGIPFLKQLGGSSLVSDVYGFLGLIYDDLNKADSALFYYNKALVIETRNSNKAGVASSLGNIANYYHNRGENSKALEYHLRSIELEKEIDNLPGVAVSLHGLSGIYQDLGQIQNALNALDESLHINMRLNDSIGIGHCLNNLAILYKHQKNFEDSYNYYLECIEIRKNINTPRNLAQTYISLSTLLSEMDSISSSTIMLQKALVICELHNLTKTKTHAYNNLAWRMKDKNMLDSSLYFANLAIASFKSLQYSFGIPKLLALKSMCYMKKEREDSAVYLGLEGLKLSNQLGIPKLIGLNSKVVSAAYKKQGNYKEALEMYELYIQMRDSIKNEETQKAAIRQQTKYEFEKAQLVKEQEEKEQTRLLEEETSRRNKLQYSLIFLGILAFFGMVLSLGFIKVSPTIAEGIIFFAFLLLFEFLLVLSDPYVDGLTNGEPMYKLLANALLAGLIFPAHAFFESVLKKRLIKN